MHLCIKQNFFTGRSWISCRHIAEFQLPYSPERSRDRRDRKRAQPDPLVRQWRIPITQQRQAAMLMSETVQNTINPRPHLSPQKEAICGHKLRPKGIETFHLRPQMWFGSVPRTPEFLIQTGNLVQTQSKTGQHWIAPAEGAPLKIQGRKEFYSPEDIGQSHQWSPSPPNLGNWLIKWKNINKVNKWCRDAAVKKIA